MKKGFTLIELLIVVAIIGILAAIAVPNFLNAQVRAKVARAQAEMRNLAVAVESYYVDNEVYMYANIHAAQSGFAGEHNTGLSSMPGGQDYATGPNWLTLTAPITYISSMPFDPFFNGGRPSADTAFNAGDDFNFCIGRYGYNTNQQDAWIMASMGPAGSQGLAGIGLAVEIGTFAAKRLNVGGPVEVNRVVESEYLSSGQGPNWFSPPYDGSLYIYDPSNGITSAGGIYRVGP